MLANRAAPTSMTSEDKRLQHMREFFLSDAVRELLERVQEVAHFDVILPRFRGHPEKRENARGVVHGETETKSVHT